MKKIGISVLLFALFSLMSCSTVSTITSSDAAATAAGVSCGKTLASLYSQYKSTGKINMTSSNTLLKVVELATYTKALRDNKNNATYKKAFAAGLVTGSSGLVINTNSMSTVNSLLSLTGLNSITSSTSATSTAAVNVATGLVNLFKVLKG